MATRSLVREARNASKVSALTYAAIPRRVDMSMTKPQSQPLQGVAVNEVSVAGIKLLADRKRVFGSMRQERSSHAGTGARPDQIGRQAKSPLPEPGHHAGLPHAPVAAAGKHHGSESLQVGQAKGQWRDGRSADAHETQVSGLCTPT